MANCPVPCLPQLHCTCMRFSTLKSCYPSLECLVSALASKSVSAQKSGRVVLSPDCSQSVKRVVKGVFFDKAVAFSEHDSLTVGTSKCHVLTLPAPNAMFSHCLLSLGALRQTNYGAVHQGKRTRCMRQNPSLFEQRNIAYALKANL